LVTVAVAPGSTAPVWSVTVPVMAPCSLVESAEVFAPCAEAGGAAANATARMHKDILRNLTAFTRSLGSKRSHMVTEKL
jgi:hypothetical protein